MEGSQLRPLPARSDAPVPLEEAESYLASTLPGLDSDAIGALAVVEFGGISRREAAAKLDVDEDAVAAALARGRKALRRSDLPLAGSGWCERAERLISDRLDGELAPPDPQRLAVHLRNCPRCVEHERRLVRAIDSVAAELAAAPAEEIAPPPPTPPRLELVVPPPALPPAPEVEPPAVEVAPAETKAGKPEPVAEEVESAAEEVEASPTIAPEPSTRISVGALAWHALLVLAVLLAIAAMVVAGIGVSGGGL